MDSGRLIVRMEVDGRGRTRMSSLSQSFPQKVTSPMYPDGEGGHALLCLQSPSGGIFSDSTLVTHVVLEEGARLTLTTQSATQVYCAGGGPGAQSLQNFDLGRGSVLEYVPWEVVPHRNSRYLQRTRVRMAPASVLLYWDMLACGRTAHGEFFAYDRVRMDLEVQLPDRGSVRDSLELCPRRLVAAETLVGALYSAVFFVIVPGRRAKDLADLEHHLASVVRASAVSDYATGSLSSDAGLVVRLASHNSSSLYEAKRSLIACTRSMLFNDEKSYLRTL